MTFKRIKHDISHASFYILCPCYNSFQILTIFTIVYGKSEVLCDQVFALYWLNSHICWAQYLTKLTALHFMQFLCKRKVSYAFLCSSCSYLNSIALHIFCWLWFVGYLCGFCSYFSVFNRNYMHLRLALSLSRYLLTCYHVQ